MTTLQYISIIGFSLSSFGAILMVLSPTFGIYKYIKQRTIDKIAVFLILLSLALLLFIYSPLFELWL